MFQQQQQQQILIKNKEIRQNKNHPVNSNSPVLLLPSISSLLAAGSDTFLEIQVTAKTKGRDNCDVLTTELPPLKANQTAKKNPKQTNKPTT